MKDEMEVMAYYMAAEKTTNMIYTIEAAIEFFEEFKIKPDEEVKKALRISVNKLKEWIEGK